MFLKNDFEGFYCGFFDAPRITLAEAFSPENFVVLKPCSPHPYFSRFRLSPNGFPAIVLVLKDGARYSTINPFKSNCVIIKYVLLGR